MGGRVGDELRGDAGDRRLARLVDVGEERDVAAGGEGLAEVAGEVAGARIQVRLERGDDPPSRKGGARGALEAALDPPEGREAWGEVGERGAEREPCAKSGQRVPPIVVAGHAQRERTEHDAVEGDRHAALHRGAEQADTVGGHEPVADHVGANRGRHACGARVVHAAHQCARPRGVLGERPLDVGEVGVDVEVIGFDVGDDRDRRVEGEERAIVLVGLDDDGVAPAPPEVAAPRLHAPADDAGRRAAGAGEGLGGHDGGGGLAVRPGDADDDEAVDRGAERLGAADHREAERRGARELGVRGGDRARCDDGTRAVDVRAVVAAVHDDAERLEVGVAGGTHVAAGDPEAAADEELGERAHPRAGDADEVHRPRIGRGGEEGEGVAPHAGADLGRDRHRVGAGVRSGARRGSRGRSHRRRRGRRATRHAAPWSRARRYR